MWHSMACSGSAGPRADGLSGPAAFRRLPAWVVMASVALGAGGSHAAVLAIDSYVPTSVSTSCAGGSCDTKTSSAVYDPTVITATSDAFGFYQNAFNAWNASNPADQQWTLVRGSDIGASTPLFFSLAAHATDTVNRNDPMNLVAGAQVVISANSLRTAGALTTPTWLENYSWSQAIRSSYTTSEIAARGQTGPFYGLDYTTACDGSGTRCGPLYPYQYTQAMTSVPGVTNGLFYDNPQGPYPAASFEAQSWITSTDEASRTITAYDGIAWGFELSETLAPIGTMAVAAMSDAADLPEPSTLASLAAALIGLYGMTARSRLTPNGASTRPAGA
jgi:hypothetical protein